MWPKKMRVEQLTAEARTLRGLVAETGSHLNLTPKLVWKSSALELGAHISLDQRAAVVPFQRRLQLAQSQEMTLREFEKRLS
jgi:hypothetical protein